MTTPEKRVPPRLVTHLFELVEQDDRAALARLRRGLGKPPGSDIASFPDVVPFIPEVDAGAGRSWPYFVVAALFASHPLQGGEGVTVGGAMRRVADNPSRNGRFRALLNAHVDDLPSHLRQVVSLLEAKGIGLDWAQLLVDLRGWTHPEHYVQRRWARDFWGED